MCNIESNCTTSNCCVNSGRLKRFACVSSSCRVKFNLLCKFKELLKIKLRLKLQDKKLKFAARIRQGCRANSSCLCKIWSLMRKT